MEQILNLDNIVSLGLLILLQAVLGFDNLLYISLESKRAPAEKQAMVRRLGIGIAVVLRIVLLLLLLKLIQYFQDPLFGIHTSIIEGTFNLHSIIVLLGGVFIIYTSIQEIFHMIGLEDLGKEERLQPRRVAKHHRLPGRRGLAHAVRIQIQRHIGNALGVKQARQVLPTAPVTADDDVLVGADGAARDAGHLHRLHHPVAARQTRDDGVAAHDDERRGQHGHHHGGQDRVEQLGRHQAVLAGQGQQHEAEFASLRQVQADAQRGAVGRTKPARQQGDDDQLEQHRQGHQQQQQGPAFQQDAPVQHHADGDEEQAQQHVVEGPDVGLDLVLVLGLGDQHAGDEGAQRQRQSALGG